MFISKKTYKKILDIIDDRNEQILFLSNENLNLYENLKGVLKENELLYEDLEIQHTISHQEMLKNIEEQINDN